MSRKSDEPRFLTWRALCLAGCVSAPLLCTITADASEPNVIVLRSDLAGGELSDNVDEELSKALSADSRFARAYFSPTPYLDIELAAGCQGSTDECVGRVATSLSAEQLLVRELRRDATGALVLSLVAMDSASAEPRRVEGTISARGETRPERVVPALVSRLYNDESASSELTAPATKVEPRRPLRIAGALSIGTSAALLASGVGAGVASRNSHARYADTAVRDEHTAERANSELDDAQRRARAANTLFVSGAVLATTGVVLLLWDHLRKDETPSPYAMNVQASTNSGLLSFSGPLGGL
jgi:hypothetical protein